MSDETPKPDQDKPVDESVVKPETVNPSPDTTPPPVRPDSDGVIADLSKRVETLEGMVTALVSTADTTPAKAPWTHRKLFG